MRHGLLPAVTVLCAIGGGALGQQQPLATIQFHYHEPIPANADLASVRAKILAQIENDCATAAKAFGRQCVVNNVNFNGISDWQFRNQGSAPTLTADRERDFDL